MRSSVTRFASADRPLSWRSTLVAVLLLTAGAGCGDGLSKKEALAILSRDVPETAECTLPLETLAAFKTQHATKATCAPRDGQNAARAHDCLGALVELGATTAMPASYMGAWPDEVAGRGLDALPAYDRHTRSVAFKSCVAMTPSLREGRFTCGTAKAEHVVAVLKSDETQATVRYARAVTVNPKLAAVEKACGTLVPPADETSLVFVRDVESKAWAVTKGEATEPSSSAPASSAH